MRVRRNIAAAVLGAFVVAVTAWMTPPAAVAAAPIPGYCVEAQPPWPTDDPPWVRACTPW